MRQEQILIIGAGIAGLSCAIARLRGRGFAVTVVERAEQPGGENARGSRSAAHA